MEGVTHDAEDGNSEALASWMGIAIAPTTLSVTGSAPALATMTLPVPAATPMKADLLPPMTAATLGAKPRAVAGTVMKPTSPVETPPPAELRQEDWPNQEGIASAFASPGEAPPSLLPSADCLVADRGSKGPGEFLRPLPPTAASAASGTARSHTWARAAATLPMTLCATRWAASLALCPPD